MLVEFVGGSLDAQQKVVERFFEYFYTDRDLYYARALKYGKLEWVYLWYESVGNLYNETVNG